MKKPNSLMFVLGAKKIISVNALYGAKVISSGRRQIATMYKRAEAKKMEEYISSQVLALNIPVNHPWVKKETKFKFTFNVIFKSGLYMRDLDNCQKNLIDGIFRALGINDSHICEIHGYKSICPSIDEEKICIQLEEYTGEPRFDKITEDKPRPERIFLGGTCPEWNGVQWRDSIILGLEKMGISYFNPVVSDWTPECIEIENKEKSDLCDCHLYILTPAMKGVYSIAEIINSAHEVKENDYGSMICGILGTCEDWGEGQWRSLGAVISMITDLSGGSPRIVGKFIDKPEDILNYIDKPKKSKRK